MLAVVLIVLSGSALATAGDCEAPDGKIFSWKPCDSGSSWFIEIQSVEALQNNKPIATLGGLDLRQPLTLKFNVLNKYNKTLIETHRFDMKAYEYNDKGGKCSWKTLETGGMTDDMDACDTIKDNCKYKNKPKHVTAVMDLEPFAEVYGSSLKIGSWYAFETLERDAHTKLNCFWIQAKLLSV